MIFKQVPAKEAVQLQPLAGAEYGQVADLPQGPSHTHRQAQAAAFCFLPAPAPGEPKHAVITDELREGSTRGGGRGAVRTGVPFQTLQPETELGELVIFFQMLLTQLVGQKRQYGTLQLIPCSAFN